MSVQITIRNVPEDIRDELAARAALKHQSMQEFLRGELNRIASISRALAPTGAGTQVRSRDQNRR